MSCATRWLLDLFEPAPVEGEALRAWLSPEASHHNVIDALEDHRDALRYERDALDAQLKRTEELLAVVSS